jgi:16S rRNA (guanine966-N2)-methyltransferase
MAFASSHPSETIASVRVIAGSSKGTRLGAVPAGTRPVSDRAREGLFSSLGGRVAGAAVLDLFAGTGALGIEALSRGAASALFVDSAPAAVRVIGENLHRAKLGPEGMVRRQDTWAALRQKIGQFDVVFADPPYATPDDEVAALLAELAGQSVVVPSGLVVVTRGKGNDTPVIPVHWSAERRLSYGDSLVFVIRAG